MNKATENISKLCHIQDKYRNEYGLWISLEEIYFIIKQYGFMNKALTVTETSKQTVLGGF
jgi:hypothetical protein